MPSRNFAWLDAAWAEPGWHEAGAAPFDLADRGLLLGDGVFDTSLVLGGRMAFRAAHVARLRAHCHVLGFAPDPARIEAAIDAALSRHAQGALRLTITRGPGPRGLAPPTEAKPTIVATVAPLRAAALFAPLTLHVTPIRRNETSPVARIKSLNYLDGVLASREALAAGCDDALFLNMAGQAACSAAGNLFALIGGQLVTPPLSDGVLDGTTRAMLLATCEDIGLEAVERSLSPGDLQRADAIVVTNALRLVAPVIRIDRTPVAESLHAATLAAHVANLVRSETGIDPRTLATSA